MGNKRPVHISVDSLYFDRIFEPQRRKFEKKLKMPLSQIRFTEIIARRNLGIKMPKNFNKIKKRQFRRLRI